MNSIEFYKETSLKETPIGEIPENWRVVKLKDLANISSGNTAPQEAVYFKDGKYPFIRVQHLNDLEEQKYPIKYDLINDLAISNLKLKKFKKGSIIFPKSGESIRLEKRAILKEDSYVVNHLAVIEPISENVSNLYLFYYMCTIRTSNYLTKTTMPSLNLSTIQKLLIPLPPLVEQQKISEVLSTIDEAIQKTDEIIAKTERLKKGLMHELLTKGIGHNEYKQTPIGTTPKTWQVVRLADVTTKIKDMDHKMPKKQEDGIPFISIRYMLKYPDFAFTINYDDPDLEYISKKDYEHQVRRFNVEKHDIIYSRFGSIGNAKLVVTEQPFIASYSIVLIKPDKAKVCPEFLVCALNSERTRRQARLQTKGATNRNLHLEDIENLKIPIPPMHEQQKIAETLLSVDKKLELEKLGKVRLERIKQSLMDLLLTGKIRVKVN